MKFKDVIKTLEAGDVITFADPQYTGKLLYGGLIEVEPSAETNWQPYRADFKAIGDGVIPQGEAMPEAEVIISKVETTKYKPSESSSANNPDLSKFQTSS